MSALQSFETMSSDSNAMDQLQEFLRQRREASEPAWDLEAFEQTLHRFFVAAEREALGHELARFDLDAPQVGSMASAMIGSCVVRRPRPARRAQYGWSSAYIGDRSGVGPFVP